MPEVATFDFHVTSECSQECAYCWGPQGIPEVDTGTALAIITRIAAYGSKRIVFTGGDPLQRDDIGALIRHAAAADLEIAVSTTGDKLTGAFLDAHAGDIDLISLPLDGSTEKISSQTKKSGHFGAVVQALALLEGYPTIDVKVATPVTKLNIDDIPNIVELLDNKASVLPGRLFYNVFQAFPRSMDPEVDWDRLVVSDADFAELRRQIEATPRPYRINWLSHGTLDKLYVMVFPDGSLTVPTGAEFRYYGNFLDIDDLDELLGSSDFDAPKHQIHARGWSRIEGDDRHGA